MSLRRPSSRPVALAAAALLALAGAGSVVPAEAQTVRWSPGVSSWVTDLSTDQRLEQQRSIRWQRGPGDATITVDPTRRYQQMTGFGASMTDSAAHVLSGLDDPIRQQTMRELFSPTEGIGLSMLRQPMGASDFAVDEAYSYDDQPPGGTDPDLSDFSTAHDEAEILPRLREARALNDRITFMASPWSAPGWMKTTDSMVGGELRPELHDAYARYFAEFVQAYAAAGVPTDYLSMQNEPLYTPADYPGMSVGPEQAATFIGDHLGPELERRGLDTEILGYDHNWDVTDYPEAMYADPEAARHVAGTAWHCYGGDVVAQSVSHNSYPQAQAFLTECSGGEWQGTEQDAFAQTMASVIGVPRNWGQSVVLWNLALDADNGPYIGGCATCRGVVTVTDDGSVQKELEYWGLGHASRFVTPGAVRIGSSQPTADVTDVAFANPDGSTVLVAHNSGTRAQTVDVAVGDRHFTASLAPGAAATYRWTSPSALAPAADLGWVDLDLGAGPDGTPTGRLTQSVDADVVDALNQVEVDGEWLSYSTPYGSTVEPASAPVALDRDGWTLTAQGATPAPGDELDQALDGDPGTRWSSGAGQAVGMSLTLDLGSEQTFTEVALDAAASSGDFLRRYTVQVSDDGGSWRDVARGSGRSGETVVPLPETTTRWLRIVSDASSGSWWSVHELELRRVEGSTDRDRPTRSLRRDEAMLADGTAVQGWYNTGRRPVTVPWPVDGMPYRLRIPASAAATLALG